MTELGRVSLAARVFTLSALGALCAVRGEGFQGLGLVVVVAVFAQTLLPSRRLGSLTIAWIEGALAATAAVVAFPENEAALPYLTIPVLIGGLSRGARGVGSVLLVECMFFLLTWWLWVAELNAAGWVSGFTWFVTAMGLGMLGAFMRGSLAASGVDATYRSALELIKELHALSGKLESGLDPVDISETMMAQVSAQLVTNQSVVLVRAASGHFAPLRYSDGAVPGSFPEADDLVAQCWEADTPVTRGRLLALPLATDRNVVAVLLAECAAPPDLDQLDGLTAQLTRESVRLYAALLFTDVRANATSEERQRLAREVHDGVAQDVASLGYLVDNLAAGATDPQQVEQVTRLRAEVSRVVGELRNSVFDLRNDVVSGQGLGQSIASFLRHIGSHSALKVHLTLDESSTRLRSEVEQELLRITQEAINNARRHSGASNLYVSVVVRPPHADIAVLDDGAGLGPGRADSHGLRIMRERADRINAVLDVESPAEGGRGTRLSVRLDHGVSGRSADSVTLTE